MIVAWIGVVNDGGGGVVSDLLSEKVRSIITLLDGRGARLF